MSLRDVERAMQNGFKSLKRAEFVQGAHYCQG